MSVAAQPLANLEKRIQDAIKQRNFENASIEQCKEQLRDAYMNFKDLQDRCVFDLRDYRSVPADQEYLADKTDQQPRNSKVLYFRPDTFMLDDAEKQRQYRSTLLKRIGQLPKPEVVPNLGDELHRQMCQSVADLSHPKAAKKLLLNYFKRRQYQLQHLRYKMLCRWAHHTLTSDQLERIGPDATLIYGKLQFSLEQTISRVQRLSQEDDFERMKPGDRPSTKVMQGGGALYVENVNIASQTLIKPDDVEVFVRGTTYKNKVNKTINKFLARLKWKALQAKNDIYEKSVEAYFAQKQANLDKQNALADQVCDSMHAHSIVTAEMKSELESILAEYHCRTFDASFQTNIDRVLHGWRVNHDTVPRQVFDRLALTLKTLALALEFGINGDIWFDKGYAFSYQISGFFPIYFQKQVVKAQFSIYDAFGADSDEVTAKKFQLNIETHIDTNIFRDVTTQPATVPTSDSLQQEFKHQKVKIIRLRSADTWLAYVIMEPSPCDWQIQQQALLSSEENYPDSLLEHALTFLDMHDLASINRVLEDSCHLHQENVKRLSKHNPHNQVVRTSSKDSHVVDTMTYNNSMNRAAQFLDHPYRTVKEDANEPLIETVGQEHSENLRHLPSHLLTAYYTLRFIKSRDAKTKILYTLNYFRAIQKRIAIDLREFGTRDRIDGASTNPYIPSQEANSMVVDQINLIQKRNDPEPTLTKNQSLLTSKMTVFDEQDIEECKDMASLRFYKLHGHFNRRAFKTCPGFSSQQIHAAYGEPLVREHPEAFVSDGEPIGQTRMQESAVKLMNRIDFIEINEDLREVYVKDDMGIYLMYDCALQDMALFEKELLKIGSWFIHKGEVLQSPEEKPVPYRDRQELIMDLLSREAEFQFQKVKLCQVYMECYEHVSDPLEQQRLMQILTDLMAKRPRFNLQAGYFRDAYDAEIECLKKQFELVRQLVDLQISLEKTENKRLQDGLGLSFTLAKEYARDKWKYQSVEALLEAIVSRYKASQKKEALNRGMTKAIAKDLLRAEDSLSSAEEEKVVEAQSDYSPVQQQEQTKAVDFDDGLSDSDQDSIDENDLFKEDKNQFSALLGLPQITLESIYQQYKEKDLTVLQLIREHNNFQEVYEGYPEYLTMLTHGSIVDLNRLFKPNSWSQDTGCLDFYDTLDFINRFFAITQAVQNELYDTLKPWDATLMTFIDMQVCERTLEELRTVIRIQEGSIVEYAGREYVEDESVVGSADKAIFYAKEMVAELSHMPKSLVNPFCAAKLDLQSVYYFEFPDTERPQNKYTLQKNGVWGAQCIIESDLRVLQYFAKQSGSISQEGASLVLGARVPSDQDIGERNLQSPCMLVTYCNMMEFLRLRQEIIIAASETSILASIYRDQCAILGQKQNKVEHDTCIIFEDGSDDQNLTSFLDDGAAHHLKIGLAAGEYDSTLLSNFNFRNSDSFKVNLLTSGLEEVRQVLQYQILQKQLLIVATRTNDALIDSYARAMAELNILSQTKSCLPNSMLNYSKLMNLGQDCINATAAHNHFQDIKSQMRSACTQAFYLVAAKKNQSRSQVVQEYAQYKAKVQLAYPASPVCVQRVMRCFRTKLMCQFTTKAITEVHLDAQKIQAVQTCKRLRVFNRLFTFNSEQIGISESTKSFAVFRYETSPLLENFPYNYLPSQFREVDLLDNKNVEVKCIKGKEIVDHFAIPSSLSLLLADSACVDDLRLFRERRQEIRIKNWPASSDEKENLREQAPDLIEPEAHLKRMVPSYTQRCFMDQLKLNQDDETSLRTGLDYEEAMGYGDSSFAQMTQFYVLIERIMALEWFIRQLSLSSQESIHFQHAMDSGLAFFTPDDFDQRAIGYLKQPTRGNSLTQQFYYDQIVCERQKRNIATNVNTMGHLIKNLITKYLKTSPEKRASFLHQYTELRYQSIIGALNKVVQDYYVQKDMRGVASVKLAIARVTLTDHVRVLYLKPANFSVCKVAVTPSETCLETSSLVSCGGNLDEMYKFERLVEPILNEKQLEPPQVTLFQSLFQSDPYRRLNLSQFVGQICDKNTAFVPLRSVLLDMSNGQRIQIRDRIQIMRLQASEFMENVHEDKSLKSASDDEIYSLEQIQTAKKYVNETATAQLYKNALMCWLSNSQLPETIEQYQFWENKLRDTISWKFLDAKDEIGKKLQQNSSFGAQMPTRDQIEEKSRQIERLVNDNSLPTEEAVAKRDQVVKALREEFAQLKKRVLMDEYFALKAQISVYGNEIERLLIEAAVKVLDAESLALAKCFMVQVPKIQYHIHPFQQFAATLYDKVDPNSNIDITNKVLAIQQLLTRTRNRSTEVETLTSGPGLVITLKDFNEILIDFCKEVILDQQAQFKVRTETSAIVERHLRQKLHIKNQKINCMQHRIFNIEKNLHSIISSRLFEKGNQLVYELDQSNRVLSIYKSSISSLEHHLNNKIQGEQLQKFTRKNNQLELKEEKFRDYKESVVRTMAAEFAADQDRIKQTLKDMASRAKITDRANMHWRQDTVMYPGGLPIGKKQETTAQQPTLQGAVIPEGFIHRVHCVCYQPNPKYPRPTLEHAELDMLSEQEARLQLAQMCTLVRKQRLMHKTKEMLLTSKFQEKINLLESHQNSNTLLWSQLQESEKRERVLKHELVRTQTSLAEAEKKIEGLNFEVRALDADRCRLVKFKSSKVDRLKELEERIKQIDVFDNIDSDKLINALTRKESQLNQLKRSVNSSDYTIQQLQLRNAKDHKQLRQRIAKEIKVKSDAVTKMEQMKLELQMLEQNDTSVTSIWKKKCLDLFEVCQSMKQENEELRSRCQDLISQGIQLADQLTTLAAPVAAAESGRLPELRESQQLAKQNSLFVSETRNATPARQAKRNNQSNYLSVSKEFGTSDETTDIVRGSSHGWKGQPEPPQQQQQSSANSRNRISRSMAQQFKSDQAMRGSRDLNDLRGILATPTMLSTRTKQLQVPSEPSSAAAADRTPAQKVAFKNNMQLQNSITRRQQLQSLHQDSLFNPQTSVTSTKQAEAVQKLKGASRFAGKPKPDFDLKGVSINQSQTPESFAK